MTITDINNKLEQLKENPSRENILDFSFTLLEWMGLPPNSERKPQLLSPQTQKLKDYLVTAPQTVQPQLYRLTAENQNIRVRFAVVKKLKKEYISQLVDNDPGLSSYQSFVKGLTQPSNGTSFIPTQPYFVHFVTTPDYNRLVLIFNQGEQKRIVSFRNRLTNTQYNKIIQQWQGIGTKSKPEIADLLWKSLDIKEVNKEFYKQIKERFDALLGIVKTQHNTATENQVKQFTVRMIGRYIFCWFLKEKGIIPLLLISKATIEKTKNYYQEVLLKLFFSTLNTKVQDRTPLSFAEDLGMGLIPYLNGGLFDESEEDKLFTKLDLDAWLLPFVEILESYDFTVDESSSQYQQVAVDPEMLGRIFENLLASQNEETEKLANQRKAFGAFYTPREIVDYMVNESIKAYLQTQWEQHIEAERTKHINNPEPVGDPPAGKEGIFGNKKHQQLAIETKRYELKQEEKEKIEKALAPLFLSQPHTDGLKKEEKTLLLSFLEKIKILDPACGSGAFPMGILHKLVELNEVLGTVKSSYELKKDILSQNIYGVDIMPMAIEIARLRAWLSLVLEEDYKPNDPKHNFGVKPLPNLDFKFVCANSLIDLGLDVFIQESKGTLHEGFTKKLVNDLKDLEALRTQFFSPTLASSEKEKLKNGYFDKLEKVIADIEDAHDPVLKQIARKLKEWNPFDDSKPSPFFSPTWMFGIDKGFDVVIGNPPYYSISTLRKENSNIYYNYYTFSKSSDIYCLFFERGINLLRQNGNISFITSNQWLQTNYGKTLRQFFQEKSNPVSLINFGGLKVFDAATVDTSILITKKQKCNFNLYACHFKNDFNLNQSITDYFNKNKLVLTNYTQDKWTITDVTNSYLSSKIEKAGKPLKDWNIEIYRGIVTGLNEAFIIDEKTKNDLINEDIKNEELIKPILRGRDIRKYNIKYANKYLINTHNGIKKSNIPPIDVKNNYPTLFEYFKPFEQDLKNREDQGDHYTNLRNCAYLNLFEKEKLIYPETTVRRSEFYLDIEGYYLDKTCFMIIGGNLKYLNAMLASKLLEWYLESKLRLLGKKSIQYSKQYIENVPIPEISDTKKLPFITRVEKILSLKKKNQATTALEKEIDALVYKLYELTYDEVKIIDKDFWMNEEEYNKFEMK